MDLKINFELMDVSETSHKLILNLLKPHVILNFQTSRSKYHFLNNSTIHV